MPSPFNNDSNPCPFNNKSLISKKLQFVILGCMITLVIINFALLIGTQNNYNYIAHTYNQSRTNFDFISYINSTIYHALYSDLRNNSTIDKMIDNISDDNNNNITHHNNYSTSK